MDQRNMASTAIRPLCKCATQNAYENANAHPSDQKQHQSSLLNCLFAHKIELWAQRTREMMQKPTQNSNENENCKKVWKKDNSDCVTNFGAHRIDIPFRGVTFLRCICIVCNARPIYFFFFFFSLFLIYGTAASEVHSIASCAWQSLFTGHNKCRPETHYYAHSYDVYTMYKCLANA